MPLPFFVCLLSAWASGLFGLGLVFLFRPVIFYVDTIDIGGRRDSNLTYDLEVTLANLHFLFFCFSLLNRNYIYFFWVNWGVKTPNK